MSSWPPAQVLADWLLLPWVFGSSLWLPQPAFQETLRPVPASGNQSSALAQGLGGRARMCFWFQNLPSPRDLMLLWGHIQTSLHHALRPRLRPGLSSPLPNVFKVLSNHFAPGDVFLDKDFYIFSCTVSLLLSSSSDFSLQFFRGKDESERCREGPWLCVPTVRVLGDRRARSFCNFTMRLL